MDFLVCLALLDSVGFINLGIIASIAITGISSPPLNKIDVFSGFQGLPGDAGYSGTDGKPGLLGLKGRRGEDGRAGMAGAPGMRGSDGLSGYRGEKGISGIPGKRGNYASDKINLDFFAYCFIPFIVIQLFHAMCFRP